MAIGVLELTKDGKVEPLNLEGFNCDSCGENKSFNIQENRNTGIRTVYCNGCSEIVYEGI